MLKPEEKDHSSTPEGNDQYRYGGYYYFLRTALLYAPQFTTRAYFPHLEGYATLTNRNTSNGSLRIVVDDKNLREPDDSDLIFFTEEFLESIQLRPERLRLRREEDDERPEVTGIYRKVSAEVIEQVQAEPPVSEAG